MKKLLPLVFIPRICRLTSDQLLLQTHSLYAQMDALSKGPSSFSESDLVDILGASESDYRSACLEQQDYTPEVRWRLERIAYVGSFVDAYRLLQRDVGVVLRDRQREKLSRQAGVLQFQTPPRASGRRHSAPAGPFKQPRTPITPFSSNSLSGTPRRERLSFEAAFVLEANGIKFDDSGSPIMDKTFQALCQLHRKGLSQERCSDAFQLFMDGDLSATVMPGELNRVLGYLSATLSVDLI